MGTMIDSGKDVVAFLKSQHQRIKGLFETVLAAEGKEREAAFASLRRLMAIHETAEEEVVHPAARRALPDGEAVVTARLNEENKAKKALAAIEKLDVASAQFETQLRALQADVLAHAESEEKQEFERLGDTLDRARLERMRSAVELAEKFAPTHPHAGVESATANLMVGPFAAMVDRARDAITGSSAKH
jgi:hemerythrin superfamily protein